MTVNNETSKLTYPGDGTETDFAFSFPILDEDYILVQVKDTSGNVTDQTLTTHYTVSGTGETFGDTDFSSGTVKFVTAPGATDTIIIKRKVPLTQEVNYLESDSFPAETHEDALDKLTMAAQELQETLNRTLRIDSATTTTLGEIPTPVADYVLARNAANDGYEWVEKTDVGVPGAIDDVVDDSTPQLGGDLDINGNDIISLAGIDINITPGTTGDLVLDGLKWPQADGTATYLLKTDGAGQLSWTAPISAGISNVVEDTTPQLGGSLDVNGNAITSSSNGDVNVAPNGTGSTNIKAGGSTRLDVNSYGLRLGSSNARVTTILDEDTLVTNSATALATQQSIKAYVDSVSSGADGQAKFWVDMLATGTAAINDSFNISGIVDDGTGIFTITIDTDFASIDYAVLTTTSLNNYTSQAPISYVDSNPAPTAGSFQVKCIEQDGTSSTNKDPQKLFAVGFGDQ